jgi:hypothetical protein
MYTRLSPTGVASRQSASGSRPRTGLLQRACSCSTAPRRDERCAACAKDGLVQRQESPQLTPEGAAPPIVHEALALPGAPLPPETRRSMEAGFKFDFSRVRIHANDPVSSESAHAVGAHAYTVGSDIVFGAHQYRPETFAGRELLAHELAHVVQQDGAGGGLPQRKLEMGQSGSAAEREADRAAQRVALGLPIDRPLGRAPTTLQRGKAGDCKVDGMTSNAIGAEVHSIIQGWCATQNPICAREIPVPGGSSKATGKTGFADLVHHNYPMSREVEVGEIKPFGESTSFTAHVQLARYIQSLQRLVPESEVKFAPMYSWIPRAPPNGMTPFHSTPQRQQFLNCHAPTSGVYFYWCTANEKDKDWKRSPVPIPKELLDKIREEIKKLQEETKGRPLPEPVRTPSWQMPEWLLPALIALACFIAVLLILMLPAKLLAGAMALIALVLGVITLGPKSAQAATTGSGGAGARGPGPQAGGAPGKDGKGAHGGGGPDAAGTTWDAALAALSRPEGIPLTPDQTRRALELGQILLDGIKNTSGEDELAKELRGMAAAASPKLEGARASFGGEEARKKAGVAGAGTDTKKGGQASTGGPKKTEGGETGGPTRGPAGSEMVEFTPVTELPEKTVEQSVPIWILSGVDANAALNATYEAQVRIDASPPFIVPVELKVVSKEGRKVVFEVMRPWYVLERAIGSPLGARYKFTFPSSGGGR